MIYTATIRTRTVIGTLKAKNKIIFYYGNIEMEIILLFPDFIASNAYWCAVKYTSCSTNTNLDIIVGYMSNCRVCIVVLCLQIQQVPIAGVILNLEDRLIKEEEGASELSNSIPCLFQSNPSSHDYNTLPQHECEQVQRTYVY